MGGLVYQHFNEEYNDPFIWSTINNDYQFVRLCRNYDDYIQKEPIVSSGDPKSSWSQETGKRRFNDCEYPVLDLSGIEIHWVHHENQEVKLLESYRRRAQRYLLNKENIQVVFLFNFFTLYQRHTDEKEIEQLFKIFNEHKHRAICILPEDLPEYLYGVLNSAKNVIIRMPGQKWKEDKRTPWGYNKQDIPEVRYTFIENVSLIKNTI
jgi:uncharacterized protein (DUF1919 family)